VHLGEGPPPGSFVQVRIVAAAPHHLTGEVVPAPDTVSV